MEQLNSFDPRERGEALAALAARCGVEPPSACSNVNMHMHSFFSYNAEGCSPSRLVWDARRAGLYAAGLCDFDVLDGMEEFLAAGRTMGLRTAVHLETRAYFRERADVDISSPGEPGVTYIMGAGFAQPLAEGTPQATGLADLRARARTRNVDLIARINPHVPEIAIDYERDVLPLTPSGNATERHIIRAYLIRTRTVFGAPREAAGYLAPLLRLDVDETLARMAHASDIEERLRARLAKRGGVGYEQPSETTFPTVDAFIDWVTSCRAIPMITWLDGTSDGEKDAAALLDSLVAKGAAALNIIPDRNWNVADPEKARLKRDHLRRIVEAADRMELPINIGTEMNRDGLPFADDLDGEVLRVYRSSFLKGARIMVGHTVLARYAQFPYTGTAARADFPHRADRNAFFAAVGAQPPLSTVDADRLSEMGPERAYAALRDRVA